MIVSRYFKSNGVEIAKHLDFESVAHHKDWVF